MLANNYCMKLVCVQNKNKKKEDASRRFLAKFLIVSPLFSEGLSNLPPMNLKSTRMCRRILHDGLNHQQSSRTTSKSKLVYVHYSFTFHLLVWVLLLLDNHLVVVPHADTVTTNKWLSSNLRVETAELLVVAQDQAINTRNYQKVICGQQVKSKCRMCW